MSESPLHTVISGAQIGADIAGLRAAHTAGLQTGGWMPKGWRTKNGPLPVEDVIRFGLRETESREYPPRTRMNIAGSEGTIQFAYNFGAAGERLTTRLIREYEQPSFQVYLVQASGVWAIAATAEERNDLKNEIVEWIEANDIHILNVAGNGDIAIEYVVGGFLMTVFQTLDNELWEESE